MLIVAFLASINANLGKILVQKSSPLFVSAVYFPLMAVLFLTIALFTSRKKIVQLKSNFRSLLPIGSGADFVRSRHFPQTGRQAE